MRFEVVNFSYPTDSPFHCEHVASDSYPEKHSSDPSFQHNSHPNCTGLDLKTKVKRHNYDTFMLQDIHYGTFNLLSKGQTLCVTGFNSVIHYFNVLQQLLLVLSHPALLPSVNHQWKYSFKNHKAGIWSICSLTIFLCSFKKSSNGSEISFMSQEQGLNFTLHPQSKKGNHIKTWAGGESSADNKQSSGLERKRKMN